MPLSLLQISALGKKMLWKEYFNVETTKTLYGAHAHRNGTLWYLSWLQFAKIEAHIGFSIVKSLKWQVHHLLFDFGRFDPYFITPAAVLFFMKPLKHFHRDNTEMTAYLSLACLM